MDFLRHPDDEEFYSGTWADQFATYEDACEYYGADSPATLAAEAEAEYQEWLAEMQAAFGPYVEPVRAASVPAASFCKNKTLWEELDDEIPF